MGRNLNKVKTLFVTLGALMSLMVFAPFAQATTYYNQPSYDVGSTSIIINDDNFQQFSTPLDVGTGSAIAVTLNVYADVWASNVVLRLVDETDTTYDSNEYANSEFNHTELEPFTFTFEGAEIMDLSAHQIKAIKVITGTHYVHAGISSGSTIPDACFYVTGPGCSTGDLSFRITNGLPDPETYFQSPVEGNVSHDFATWWVCANIPAPDGMTGYSIEVLYGEVGDGFTESDSTKDAIGVIPIYDEPSIDECPLITKSFDLTPGDWHAQINLLDQDDNIIASSEEITFNITSGDKVDFANDGQVTRDKYAGCDNYGNAIQRQGCKLMVFLLYPDDGYIDGNLAELHDTIFAQAPFAYFDTIQGNIDGVDIEPTNPNVSITLTNVFGDAHASTIDYDILTDNNPVLSDNLETIKPWIVTALWLGFATYLMFRIFSIFRAV